MLCVSEYTTFLSLPVNATQVHVINRAPLFTHMGECCFHSGNLIHLKTTSSSYNFKLLPVTAAVVLRGQYIVGGRGAMSLNVTYPSVLDEDSLEYHLYLTPDLLPEMEELLLPGPLQEEINVEVGAFPF